jgi:hypothetical protein
MAETNYRPRTLTGRIALTLGVTKSTVRLVAFSGSVLLALGFALVMLLSRR